MLWWIDVFVIQKFSNDTFWKHAVVPDRLMIAVVSILALVAEMELNDAFVILVFWNETFLKHLGAHNRLVIVAVTFLTVVAGMLWTDALLIQNLLNYRI